MKRIIAKVNVSKTVCDHLLGENHSQGHRMITGVVIGFIGVGISKIPTSIHLFHYIFDLVGFGVHGIGAVPFIEKIMANSKQKDKEE